jgi:hypothetical protein
VPGLFIDAGEGGAGHFHPAGRLLVGEAQIVHQAQGFILLEEQRDWRPMAPGNAKRFEALHEGRFFN